MPPKAPITCNWMRSNVTNETLADFVKSGYLPKKDVMSSVPLTRQKRDHSQRTGR